MLTQLVSSSLAFFTAIANLMGLFIPAPAIRPPADDFVPVLRFTVASDVHIQTHADEKTRRMTKMLKTSYAIAEADERYDRLDGVMFAGDITDQGRYIQYLAFESVLGANLKPGTQPMVIVAKSHDGNTYGKKAMNFFESLSGLTTDFHYVLNGFHFVGISTTHDPDAADTYTAEQLRWLDEQLALAAAADPTKPIFVTHHEHVEGTVYGSRSALGERWGTPVFYEVLAKYPQVVDFSGHSHYPLNDPRSIWQGDFTALGTSSLNYYEFTVDDVKTVHPENYRKAAQMWVVEADANNRLRLRGYDLMADAFVCEYIIENPADKDSFAYTPAKMLAASAAPVFEQGTQLQVKRKLDKTYRVDIPAANATDGKVVFLYRVFVLNERGETVAAHWELSGYYFTPPPTVVGVNIGKLAKGEYTLRVVAENAYGMQSEAITAPLTVK